MKEQSTTIREPFVRGLRPVEASPRRKDWFLDVRGGETQGGTFHTLAKPTHVEWPLGYPQPTFPFPQLLELRHYLILCSSTHVFLAFSHMIPAAWEYQFTTSAPRGSWTVADFGPWFVLCNGWDMLEFDLDTQKLIVSDRIPRASCVYNHNNRLILGGVFI